MVAGGINDLDHTIPLCSRIEETRAFYRDVMGFAVELDTPIWVSFRVGSSLLTLRPRGPWAAWHDGAAVPDAASVQLAFRVAPPAIDAWHAELVAKGVPIVRPPIEIASCRHRAMFFRDPEDNVIERQAGI